MKIQLSDHFNYKRLLRFAFPSIIMMIFTSIYGVVDGLFVSNFVGKTAFASINLIMPFTNILGGVGFMFGSGGSALVSKTLGEKKNEDANRYFSMIIKAIIIVGLILSILSIVFLKNIISLLGATDDMKPHCLTYGIILISFTITFMLQYAFQSFLVVAEKPKFGLVITVIAGITNMILDFTFVYLLDLKVAGAAIATGISQSVGTIIPLIYFIKSKNGVLHLKLVKIDLKPILKVCFNGISEMISSVTAAIVGMIYNFQLLKYAQENGVASYGVLMYVQFVFIAFFIGFSMGTAPIVGYHYGAQNEKELKNLLKKSFSLMILTGVIMTILAQFLTIPLSNLFVGYNDELCNMTIRAFRITTFAYIIVGINIYSSSFFTALNNGLISAIISFLRTFIFKLAAILTLPIIFGLDGIWYSELSAELIAFIISIFFIIFKNKQYHYL